MRQTFQINLANFAFHIDEDAYNKLHSYLSNIEKAIDDIESAKEILQDVEARITEILLPITQQDETTIITLKDVEEVIQIIGSPTDFGTGVIKEEEKPSDESSNYEFTPPYIQKRLHRDPYSKVFGGVCSGLGAFFKVSPILFRVLFIFGVIWGASLFPQIIPTYVFLTYIILWIVMPKAITLEQRRQMYGDDGIQYNTKYTRFRKNTSTKTTNGFWRMLTVVLGVALLILSFVGIMALILSILFSSLASNVFPNLAWIQIIEELIFIPEQSFALLTGIGLLVGIPLLVIFYLGLYLLFKFKKGGKTIGALALLFWLVGLGLFIYSSVVLAQGFKERAKLEETIYPEPFDGDTLYLQSNQWAENSENTKWLNTYRLRTKFADKRIITEGDPTITITKNADRFAIIMTRIATGKNMEAAEANAQNIEFFWLQKDSILQVDPHFTLRSGSKMRFQEIEITIEIPKGKSLKVAPELEGIIKQ